VGDLHFKNCIMICMMRCCFFLLWLERPLFQLNSRVNNGDTEDAMHFNGPHCRVAIQVDGLHPVSPRPLSRDD
jgi:hypothetical protein